MSDKIIKKELRNLTINYNAYGRIEKDIFYYNNELTKLNEASDNIADNKKEQLFSEIEEVINDCREKQEIYREKLVKLYEENMGNSEITETDIFSKIRDLFYG
jgi:hypothetical protein